MTTGRRQRFRDLILSLRGALRKSFGPPYKGWDPKPGEEPLPMPLSEPVHPVQFSQVERAVDRWRGASAHTSKVARAVLNESAVEAKLRPEVVIPDEFTQSMRQILGRLK